MSDEKKPDTTTTNSQPDPATPAVEPAVQPAEPAEVNRAEEEMQSLRRFIAAKFPETTVLRRFKVIRSYGSGS